MPLESDLERARRRGLLVFLFAWSLWWTSVILQTHLPANVRSSSVWTGLNVALLLSWVTWTLAHWRSWRKLSEARKSGMERVFDDERLRSLRQRALASGFTSLVIAQSVLLAISIVHPFSASLASKVSILVGVCTVIGAFLILERDS